MKTMEPMKTQLRQLRVELAQEVGETGILLNTFLQELLRRKLLAHGPRGIDLYTQCQKIVAQLPAEKRHQLRHGQLKGLDLGRMPYHSQKFLRPRLLRTAVAHGARQNMLLRVGLLICGPCLSEESDIYRRAVLLSLLLILGDLLLYAVIVKAESRRRAATSSDFRRSFIVNP